MIDNNENNDLEHSENDIKYAYSTVDVSCDPAPYILPLAAP